MIRFVLKDPEDIAPWKTDDGLCLHWITLTDSYFWMSLGDVKLFRHSQEFVKKQNMNDTVPYMDEPLFNLLCNIINILYHVATPVPDDVFEAIRTYGQFESYMKSVSDRLAQTQDRESRNDEMNLAAIQWIYDRKLDQYFRCNNQNLFFFRHNDQVYIRWLASARDDTGTQVWEEASGEHIMDYTDFTYELESFFVQFADNMDNQIYKVIHNPLDHIFIDQELLLESQRELRQFVDDAFRVIKADSRMPEEWKILPFFQELDCVPDEPTNWRTIALAIQAMDAGHGLHHGELKTLRLPQGDSPPAAKRDL